MSSSTSWIEAGRVGRAHGLDGSFHVTRPEPGLLALGMTVRVGETPVEIERLAGTAAKPIVRVTGCSTREQADAIRGEPIWISRDDAPPLEADEWWADDLVGCRVTDGEREVGTVRRLLALPSCECLEVERAGGGADLLVPLVRDAIRSIDVHARRIDVDMGFVAP